MNPHPLVLYRHDEAPPAEIPDGLALWVLHTTCDTTRPDQRAWLHWTAGRIYWDVDVWRLCWLERGVECKVLGWMMVPISTTRDFAAQHAFVWDPK